MIVRPRCKSALGEGRHYHHYYEASVAIVITICYYYYYFGEGPQKNQSIGSQSVHAAGLIVLEIKWK